MGSVCVLERRSALAGTAKHTGRGGSGGQRRLHLGEIRGWTLVMLAAFPDTLPDLERVTRPLLGIDLPTDVGSAVTAGGRTIMKTGPEHFYVTMQSAGDLTASLRAAVGPSEGAVTPLTHSRTRIFIEGAAARQVLSMGIPLDFHPQAFPVNRFALTGLHHTPFLVHRSGAERYELYALRSFALWTWEWLTDAALQFGYEIVEPA
jgi:heterotetrameric sarcosine oxidase gamma subunit